MQISSINAQVFTSGVKNNSQRIYQLEQKNEEIKWGSESCSGSLGAKDAHELELRREYQALQNKHTAIQWASEGCNVSLSAEDMKRMSQIESELLAMEPKTAPIVNPVSKKSIYDIPTGNIYGVPDHTFYGEWAR